MGGTLEGGDVLVATLRRRVVAVTQVIGLAVVAVAALALMGNTFEVERLARLVGRGNAIKPNTSALLAACGAVLAIGPAAAARIAVRTVGAVVAVAAGLVLVQYPTGWDLGIDELLMDDPFPSDHPGRMAELTATCLVLVGAAIALRGVVVAGRKLSSGLLVVSLVLSVVAVLGHLFSAEALESTIGSTRIAFVTAICLTSLAGSLLAVDADERWFQLLLDDGPGGVLLRRFVPTVVTLMFVVAWFRVRAAQEEVISDEVGVAILTTMIAAIVVIAFVMAAARMRATELDRREAERSAAAVRTDLQAVIDSAPAVVTIKDADARFRFVNHRMRELMGIGDRPLSGLRDRDVFDAELASAYEETDRRVLEHGETLETFDRIDVGDAERIYVAVKFPLLAPDGTVTGVGMIATDITEQQAAAARERDLEARLARSLRLEALGQLAGGISHDFNNLLTVILVTTEMLRQELDPASDAARDVRTIATAGERARDLTGQLLSFARRTMGRPEVVDLGEVVVRHADLLHRTLGDPIELVVVPCDHQLPVRIDPAQLGAALVNLAVNARDAMPDGGRLTISCDVVQVEDADVGDDASGPGRYARLTVADTGSGMEPDVLARAFEPFFTTKGEGRGSGLGLATVYGSVAAAGGTVRLYSDAGVGTVVRVYLPLVDAPVGTSGAPRPVPERPSGDGSTAALVVEDEPTVLVTTARILRDAGFTVLEAGSPDAALALVDGGARVDVVVTDVMMPGMTGPQLVERLHTRRPDLPVVYVSGYTAGVLEPQRLLDDGATLVEKPFTTDALVAAVDGALRRR